MGDITGGCVTLLVGDITDECLTLLVGVIDITGGGV